MSETNLKSEILFIEDWVMRVRKPPDISQPRVMVMLHGWTGDENSMWVFARNLPQDMLMIAPRAPFPARQAGYSWYHKTGKSLPVLEDFHQAVEALFGLLKPAIFPQAEFSEMHLVGFSQGAALAYALTLYYPERVASLAGLSGFVPEGAEFHLENPALRGLPVFMAHGSLDELVPVSLARQGVELFQQAGAQVTYCEDDVGHKLSANCFRGLEAFYRRQSC